MVIWWKVKWVYLEKDFSFDNNGALFKKSKLYIYNLNDVYIREHSED